MVYSTTESPVHLRRKALRPDLSLEGRLYAIGVPAILNLALPSLLVTFLNGLLAAFSESYVVVLGIYYKLQTFLYLPANGIVQGMRPLIGYNYGAKEHARVAKLYQLTLGMSAVIMAAGTVICMAASAPLIGLFSSNPETIAIGQTALRIICLGFVVSAVSTTSSGALEGLGKGAASLVISLCRYVIFIMPLAWLLCRQLGPTGVWHASGSRKCCRPSSPLRCIGRVLALSVADAPAPPEGQQRRPPPAAETGRSCWAAASKTQAERSGCWEPQPGCEAPLAGG